MVEKIIVSFFFLSFSYTTAGSEPIKYKIFSSTVPLLKSDKVIAIAIAAVSIESSTERVEANRSVLLPQT